MNNLERALEIIRARRENAINKAEETRRKLLEDKEFASIENTLGGLDFELARREVYGLDVSGLRVEIERINNQRDELLKKLGYNKEDFKPRYYCKMCGDTGYVEGKRCVCLENERKRLNIEENTELENSPALDKIDFSVYCEMSGLFEKCARFLTRKFVENEGELSLFLLMGETGIGKTYLAKAALRDSLEGGGEVLFLNAIKLNKLFLNYHCAPLEQKEEVLREINACDALVIDDLGVEPLYNNVTLPYFYELIVERLGKKTLITTNLSQRDLEEKYGQRIFSRLMDKRNSAVISLKGKDLRFSSI